MTDKIIDGVESGWRRWKLRLDTKPNWWAQCCECDDSGAGRNGYVA